MPMKLLPKGHEVTYIVDVDKGDRKRDYIRYFKKDGVSGVWEKRDGKRFFVIKAFVAGDTRRKGISVVALDNPQCCLISWKNETAKLRKILRSGEITTLQLDEMSSLNFGSPTCQFS